jgi:YegS/Rv2252/BmrU family lipid kinase
MSTNCQLIVNPASGSYSPRIISEALGILGRHGIVPRVLETQGPNDAAEFARRACVEEPSPLIIAAGGDGTVNGIVNGLEPGRATLAVLPVGTANVLALELGIASLEDAAARIARGETRPASAGVVEGADWRRAFVLMAGIGFDAAVVEGVRLREKRLFGKGAYLLSALRCMVRNEQQPFEVRADGITRRCHTAVVCNMPRYGGEYLLAPGADLFAPGFQVACIHEKGGLPLMRLARALAQGISPDRVGVELFHARELQVAGEQPVQADGDHCGHAPVSIRSLPDFLQIVV